MNINCYLWDLWLLCSVLFCSMLCCSLLCLFCAVLCLFCSHSITSQKTCISKLLPVCQTVWRSSTEYSFLGQLQISYSMKADTVTPFIYSLINNLCSWYSVQTNCHHPELLIALDVMTLHISFLALPWVRQLFAGFQLWRSEIIPGHSI
jgi:uncharacterized membrane protein